MKLSSKVSSVFLLLIFVPYLLSIRGSLFHTNVSTQQTTKSLFDPIITFASAQYVPATNCSGQVFTSYLSISVNSSETGYTLLFDGCSYTYLFISVDPPGPLVDVHLHFRNCSATNVISFSQDLNLTMGSSILVEGLTSQAVNLMSHVSGPTSQVSLYNVTAATMQVDNGLWTDGAELLISDSNFTNSGFSSLYFGQSGVAGMADSKLTIRNSVMTSHGYYALFFANYLFNGTSILLDSLQVTGVNQGGFGTQGNLISPGSKLTIRRSTFRSAYLQSCLQLTMSGGTMDLDGSNTFIYGSIYVYHSAPSQGNTIVINSPEGIDWIGYTEPVLYGFNRTSVVVTNASVKSLMITLGVSADSFVFVDGVNCTQEVSGSWGSGKNLSLTVANVITSTYVQFTGSLLLDSSVAFANISSSLRVQQTSDYRNSTISFDSLVTPLWKFYGSMNQTAVSVRNSVFAGSNGDSATVLLQGDRVDSTFEMSHCVAIGQSENVFQAFGSMSGAIFHQLKGNNLTSTYTYYVGNQGVIAYSSQFGPGSQLYVAENSLKAYMYMTDLIYFVSMGGQLLFDASNRAPDGIGKVSINTYSASPPHTLHFNGFTGIGQVTINRQVPSNQESIVFSGCSTARVQVNINNATGLTMEFRDSSMTELYIYGAINAYWIKSRFTFQNISTPMLYNILPGFAIASNLSLIGCNLSQVNTQGLSGSNGTRIELLGNTVAESGFNFNSGGLTDSTFIVEGNYMSSNSTAPVSAYGFVLLRCNFNLTNNVFIGTFAAGAFYWGSETMETEVWWVNNTASGSSALGQWYTIGSGSVFHVRNSIFNCTTAIGYSIFISVSGGRVDHDGSNRHKGGNFYISHTAPSSDNLVIVVGSQQQYLSYSEGYGVSYNRTSLQVYNSSFALFVQVSLGSFVESVVVLDGVTANNSIAFFFSSGGSGLSYSLRNSHAKGGYVMITGAIATLSTFVLFNTNASTYIQISGSYTNSNITIDSITAPYYTQSGGLINSRLVMNKATLNSANAGSAYFACSWSNSKLHLNDSTIIGAYTFAVAVWYTLDTGTVHRVTNCRILNVYTGLAGNWSDPVQGALTYLLNSLVQPTSQLIVSNNLFQAAHPSTYLIYVSSRGGQILHDASNRAPMGMGQVLVSTFTNSPPAHTLHFAGFTNVSSIFINHGSTIPMTGESIRIVNCSTIYLRIYTGISTTMNVEVRNTTASTFMAINGGTATTQGTLSLTNVTTETLSISGTNLQQCSFSVTESKLRTFYLGFTSFTSSCIVLQKCVISSTTVFTGVLIQTTTAVLDNIMRGYLYFRDGASYGSYIRIGGNNVNSNTSAAFLLSRFNSTTSYWLMELNSFNSTINLGAGWYTSPMINSTVYWVNTVIQGTSGFYMPGSDVKAYSLYFFRNCSFIATGTQSYDFTLQVLIGGGGGFDNNDGSCTYAGGPVLVSQSGSEVTQLPLNSFPAMSITACGQFSSYVAPPVFIPAPTTTTTTAPASNGTVVVVVRPTLSTEGFGYRYFVYAIGSYASLTGTQFGLNLLFTSTYTNWQARRFLFTTQGDGAVRIMTASSAGSVKLGMSKTATSVDSIQLNGATLNDFQSTSTSGLTAIDTATCSDLVHSTSSQLTLATSGSFNLKVGQTAQTPYCRQSISWAGVAYSSALFVEAPLVQYVYFPATSQAASQASFKNASWKGPQGQSFEATLNTSLVLIGDTASPTSSVVAVRAQQTVFFSTSAAVSISNDTHSGTVCTIANQLTFNITSIPANTVQPIVGVASQCFQFDTVDDLHLACQLSDSCYGFTTILMRYPMAKEMPLCMYVGSAAASSDTMPYPRLFHAKPSSVPQTCATSVQKSGRVAVHIQQTMMATGTAVVRVNGVRVAMCGAANPFANGFLGGDGRCQQWALCYVGSVPSGADITVTTLTKLGQGGCDNSLGAMFTQLSVDPVEQVSTTVAPIRQLDTSSFTPRVVRKSAENTDAIKLFVYRGWTSALSVAQTHFLCSGDGCKTAPNVSMTSLTACQQCGGYSGFLDGRAGMSDRCDVSQFCGNFLALQSPSSSASGAQCDNTSSVPAASYSGWLNIAATIPTLSSDEGTCVGFQGQAYVSPAVANPTIPVFPLITPSGASPATLFGRRTDSTATVPSGAAALFTLLPTSEPIEANYVPSWYTIGNNIQSSLSRNSTQVCVVDHTLELEAKCTFFIPVNATYINVRVAQTDFVSKAVTVQVKLDGSTVTSTDVCGGSSTANLFGRAAGQQERCGTFSSCSSRFIYSNDSDAATNTAGVVVVSFPKGLRGYACDYLASVIIDFSAPDVPSVSCTDVEYECPGERRCIPAGYVCDGILDCDSGSDEQLCAKSSSLTDEAFCIASSQQQVVATSRLDQCTMLAVKASTAIHQFNGTHCQIIAPAAALAVLANPQTYLCPTPVLGTTLLVLNDRSSFGLCRSSIQCTGNGVAFLNGGACECSCNDLFSGPQCDVPLKLDLITEIVCVLASVQNTLTIPLASVAKVLRLSSSTVAVSCTSMVRDISETGQALLRVTCTASSNRDRSSDAALHYRRLLDQSLWPTINEALAAASLPDLIYLTGRSAMTPNVYTSRCQGSSCLLNQSDHVTITIASNVSISSVSLAVGPSSSQRGFSEQAVTCQMASVSGSSGCLRSICDVPLSIDSNTTISIVSVSKDPETLLTSQCSGEGATVLGRLAVGNVDTFTNDTSVQVLQDFNGFLGSGIAMCIIAFIAWAGGAGLYLKFLGKLDALKAKWEDSPKLRSFAVRKVHMLLRLRLIFDVEENKSIRLDRLSGGLVATGGVLAVLAAFLLTYHATAYNAESNFSVMYEEYSDSLCEQSSTSYMPRRLFVASVGSDCDKMLSFGDSVGSTYATGECLGEEGSYVAKFKMAASQSSCRKKSQIHLASGQCVPLQTLDPSASRSSYVRLTCSSSEVISDRVDVLKAFTGTKESFVDGEVRENNDRLFPPTSPDGTYAKTPFLIGQALADSSAFTYGMVASQATPQDFDGNLDARRVVYQSISSIPDSTLVTKMATMSSFSEGPTIPEVPIGYLFGGFGTSEPVTWVGAGPSSHRYYGIAGGPFDMGAHFPIDRENPADGDGYAISLWMKADSTTLGFAYAVTDAFEDVNEMTVTTLERLAGIIDSGNSGTNWFDSYRVYHALYVDGPGRALTVATASPTYTDRVLLINFDLQEIGQAAVMDGRWHEIAINFAAENKKVRVQLIIDGESSYSKVGWSNCVTDLPEAVTAYTVGARVPVQDTVTDRVTRGGLLSVGYFNGAVFGLRAHQKSMLNTDFLATGTQLMRDSNAFEHQGTIALGSALLVLAGLLFFVFLYTSISTFRAFTGKSPKLEQRQGAQLFESIMGPLFSPSQAAQGKGASVLALSANPTSTPTYTRISFSRAVRWTSMEPKELREIMEEIAEQSGVPAKRLALLLLSAKQQSAASSLEDEENKPLKELPELTPAAWNDIVDQDLVDFPPDPEEVELANDTFGLNLNNGKANEFGNVKAGDSKPQLQDGAADNFSAGDSATSSSPGQSASHLAFLGPIVGVFQGMYVWSSSISFPSVYDDYFSGLFAFASVDVAGVFPTVAPMLTSVVQVIFALVLLAAVAYLLLEDERAFDAHLAKYIWRRDAMASEKPEVLPEELATALVGHPRQPTGSCELVTLPIASAHTIDCFNGVASSNAAEVDVAQKDEVAVQASSGQTLTVTKADPKAKKGQLLVNGGEPLSVVGARCVHHESVLTALVQTEVWPFDNRPKCCIWGCGRDTGTIFSCGEEFIDEEGQACVCLYALCEAHSHLSTKETIMQLLFSKVRTFRMNGFLWALCAIGLALANAAYTPVLNTALMIVACHPYYQCEFDCWENMNQKFILAAFLSIVTITLLGVGLPVALFAFLYRRNQLVAQNSLGPEYEGKYTDPETTGLHMEEWRRFVASDHSAMASLYLNLKPKWLFFPPLLVICKAALLAPAIALEPRSLEQRIGCGVVQIVITLLLFATTPYTSSIQMHSMRAAELHQLIQLGLQNIDLVLRNDSNKSLAVLMVIITIVYVVFAVLVAVVAFAWPIIRTKLRNKRLATTLKRHNLVFSLGVTLYLESIVDDKTKVGSVLEVQCITDLSKAPKDLDELHLPGAPSAYAYDQQEVHYSDDSSNNAKAHQGQFAAPPAASTDDDTRLPARVD